MTLEIHSVDCQGSRELGTGSSCCLDKWQLCPYLEERSTEPAMQRRQTSVAILALGLLLVSPFAWGCEGTGMQNCSMSDCPMTDPQPVDDCHESVPMAEHESSSCDAQPESWLALCDAPIDQEPVNVDSAPNWDHSTTPLIGLAATVEIQLHSMPPDLISEAISSQQHELGRFTLLSSFLL